MHYRNSLTIIITIIRLFFGLSTTYYMYLQVCMCICMCVYQSEISVIKGEQLDGESSNNNNRRFSQNIVINKLAYTLACMLSAFRWTLRLRLVRLNQYLWTPLFALAVGRLKRREQFSKRMLRFCKMILGPNTGKSLMHKVELSVRFQHVISISYDYLLYK